MSSDLVANGGALEFTPEQRQMIRDTYAGGCSDGEFAVLMEIARARRLNPLFRQIHFVERWDSEKHRKVWSAQVSIDGLRAIAEHTGNYAGQDEPEYVDAPDGTLKLCKVRVWRKDWPRPAVGVAYWSEYVQTIRDKQTGKTRPAAMWARMPHVMLAKVAESIALRKAFPEDMGGLYSTDEMAQAEVGIEDAPGPTPAPKTRATRPAPESERPAANDAAPAEAPADPPPAPKTRATRPAPESERPAANDAAPAEAPADPPPVFDEPAALVEFGARVQEIELPGEAVAVWLKHRAALEALPAADREGAWSTLVKHTEKVGKMKNAAVWLKKAIAEEDARRPAPPAPADPADRWMADVAAVTSSRDAAAVWEGRPEVFRAEPAQLGAFDALVAALHAANAAAQPAVTIARVRAALATKVGYQPPTPPDGPGGTKGDKKGQQSSSKSSDAPAEDAPAQDGPAALAAWRAHIADKPRADGRDLRAREAELCEVANSYLKRAPGFAAAGLADDALDAARFELRARGCGDPDALLTALAKRSHRHAA